MALKFDKTKPKNKRTISRENNKKIIQTSTSQESIKKAKRSLRLSVIAENLGVIVKSIVTLILATFPSFIVTSYRSTLIVQAYNLEDINAKTLWLIQEQLKFANVIFGAILLIGLYIAYDRIKKYKFVKYKNILNQNTDSLSD